MSSGKNEVLIEAAKRAILKKAAAEKVRQEDIETSPISMRPVDRPKAVKKAIVYPGFDEALWKAGVQGGAFSGTKDPDATWYLLEVDDKKVAIASAVPGPGELTNISYFVDPEERGNGYGTKIACQVTDLHEKASFLMMKSNEASIKVALAALKNKFSMTLGHNTVRLTKTAGLIKESVSEWRLRAGYIARKLQYPKEVHGLDIKTPGERSDLARWVHHPSYAGVEATQESKARVKRDYFSVKGPKFPRRSPADVEAGKASLRTIFTEASKTADKKEKDLAKKELAVAGVTAAGIGASETANKMLFNAMIRNPKKLSIGERVSLRQAAREHDVRFFEDMPPGEEMTMAVPGKGPALVMASTHSPKDIVLHEIGHAKTITKPVIGRLLHAPKELSERISRMPVSARAAGTAAGVAAIAADPDSVVAKTIPYALAATAPHVGRIPAEIAASGYAIGHLLKKREFGSAMKGTARLTSALGSYALPAIGIGASAELLRRYFSKREKRADIHDVVDPIKVKTSLAPRRVSMAPKVAADKSHQDTVGTTLESKIHESFTVAADRIFRSGIMTTNERKDLSGAIGDMLNRFRNKVDPEVYGRKMTDRAHEHLKAAVSRQIGQQAIRARVLQGREFSSGFSRQRAVDVAAEQVSAEPVGALVGEERRRLVGAIRGMKSLKGTEGTRAGGLFKEVGEAVKKMDPQKKLL